MKPDEMVITRLRAKIPKFECIEGCADCCGPIFFSDWEWEQVEDKRKAVDIDCPYMNSEKKCDIYEDRPIACRLFGVVKTGIMACHRGCLPDSPLTLTELMTITTEWMDVVNR